MNDPTFTISREIGIDMGHRVPTHGSKCHNLHGHRYRIIATCIAAAVATAGEQKDMVLDFGFLKDVMMQRIDAICDHGMVLWVNDPWLDRFLVKENLQHISQLLDRGAKHVFIPEVRDVQTKLCVVPFVPTAERLSQWWYDLMQEDVMKRSNGIAILEKVEVFETPNCSAVFIPA
jgi:6-pyruvoyltetrahydropterin/6-carboxytetrahydropterin synthase